MNGQLRQRVLKVAKRLILKEGFDNVGMRDIAKELGLQPIQVYRLKLSKSDILAELIIELNNERIQNLPAMLATVKGSNAFERICAYLLELYESDIRYKPLSSVGAAFGWTWGGEYEKKIVGQVWQLIAPIASWMREKAMTSISARCYGAWSLYYVGYRRAVVHAGSATECLEEIRPSLEILLGR